MTQKNVPQKADLRSELFVSKNAPSLRATTGGGDFINFCLLAFYLNEQYNHDDSFTALPVHSLTHAQSDGSNHAVDKTPTGAFPSPI